MSRNDGWTPAPRSAPRAHNGPGPKPLSIAHGADRGSGGLNSVGRSGHRLRHEHSVVLRSKGFRPAQPRSCVRRRLPANGEIEQSESATRESAFKSPAPPSGECFRSAIRREQAGADRRRPVDCGRWRCGSSARNQNTRSRNRHQNSGLRQQEIAPEQRVRVELQPSPSIRLHDLAEPVPALEPVVHPSPRQFPRRSKVKIGPHGDLLCRQPIGALEPHCGGARPQRRACG